MRAGFETLVEAGYAPEIAYYECLHELKLIVDLMYENGLAGMRYSISDTAEFGDYTRGKRVVDEHVREEMKGILADIQSGEFAREWVEDMDNNEARLKEMRAEAAQSQLETVGKELRGLMHRAGEQVAHVASVDVPVALLGYGTVGAAVHRLLEDSADEIERATGHRLRVTHALVRDTGKERAFAPAPGVLTDDFATILDDPSIQVVAEVMGGVDPAGELRARAAPLGAAGRDGEQAARRPPRAPSCSRRRRRAACSSASRRPSAPRSR